MLFSESTPASKLTPEELSKKLFDISVLKYEDDKKENFEQWIKEYEAEKKQPLPKSVKGFLALIDESLIDIRYVFNVKGQATHSM